jgi:hypothetical protein
MVAKVIGDNGMNSLDKNIGLAQEFRTETRRSSNKDFGEYGGRTDIDRRCGE